MEETDHKSESIGIDEDLWPEIFKRLPTKSLGRCRCVCKLWKSLISSTLIINLHHSFKCSAATPANLKPYLLLLEGKVNSYALCRPSPNPSVVDHFNHDLLHFPFRCFLNPNDDDDAGSATHFFWVDVIEGVICISYDPSFDSTLLWNPLIRKYVNLPWLPYPLDPSYARSCDGYDYAYSAIGFGYDRCNCDFKVVRIWLRLYFDEEAFCTSPPSSIYEVYSARQGTWRKAITNINFTTCRFDDFDDIASRTSCFVNGKIHWLPDDYVLMFDCEREEFTTMELPEQVKRGALRLWEYAGMLSAAVCVSKTPVSTGHGGICTFFPGVYFVDLWVMEEEHGWKKLYRIPDNAYVLHSDGIGTLSLRKLFPYGPHEWLKFLSLHDTFSHKVSSGYVYEESLFLMDHPKAQSYSKNEIVRVCSEGEM